MPTRVVYYFNVRDPLRGRWIGTRYRMTEEAARERYGEGNYERLDWSRVARTGGPKNRSMAHLASRPAMPNAALAL